MISYKGLQDGSCVAPPELAGIKYTVPGTLSTGGNNPAYQIGVTRYIDVKAAIASGNPGLLGDRGKGTIFPRPTKRNRTANALGLPATTALCRASVAKVSGDSNANITLPRTEIRAVLQAFNSERARINLNPIAA